MDLRTKRKLELDSQKEERRKNIVKAASEVFKEKGIDTTKMTDVADKAEVGVATVYRYFDTKLDLAIDAATYIWEEEINTLYYQFNDSSYIKLSPLEKVRLILNVFLSLYKEFPDFLSFLENFDNFIVKEQIPLESLEDYEKNIISLKPLMFEALEEGKKDGLIKQGIDNNVFYMTVTHSLMSLSQKLILRGTILKSDFEVDGELQIKLIIEMAMSYILK